MAASFRAGDSFIRFPNLTHLTLAMLPTCALESLLALSKLQSLEIDAHWDRGAKHLISHLNKLPSLRRLAIRDSTGELSLTSEGLRQVCRCGGSTQIECKLLLHRFAEHLWICTCTWMRLKLNPYSWQADSPDWPVLPILLHATGPVAHQPAARTETAASGDIRL